MSPRCMCGNFVSKDYVRVFRPDTYEGEHAVRACPRCNRVREDGKVRKARAKGASYQEGEIQ